MSRPLGGVNAAAGLDCCLYLLRKHAGQTVANSLACCLVIPPHRQGGQAQFIAQALPDTAQDNRIGELISWVRQHLVYPHQLDRLAAKVRMNRHLLESTPLSIADIAEQIGLGSTMTLRQHFRKVHGVIPQAWRNTFQ